jgi:DNA-binding NarL/FixJ family response regulator
MVEAKGLLSNPASRPAFDRLLHILSDGADFLPENSAVTWENSTSVRKHQKQHRLKPEEIDDLVYAYQAGELVEDLAARFSIHRTTVIEHVRRSGIKMRNVK